MQKNNHHNQQYQDNEKKILWGYLSELKRVGADDAISLKAISKASGLPYRTVLGHYKNFSELERINVEITANILCHLADECHQIGYDRPKFLMKLLVIVSRETVRFEIECSRKSISVWERILSYSRDILTQGWPSYGEEMDEIIFHRFCAEFIGVIYLWSKSDFAPSDLGKHHLSLIYLTEHAARREMQL